MKMENKTCTSRMWEANMGKEVLKDRGEIQECLKWKQDSVLVRHVQYKYVCVYIHLIVPSLRP
jgi:hypothetical protein